MGLFRRKKERQPDAQVYSNLRRQVLNLSPDQLGDEPAADFQLLALLMETGYPDAVATLVAVADGTTSLYFSNGGGVIGAGEHATVAEASRRWLETGSSFLPQLSEASDPGPPAEGLTQFVAVTRAGLKAAVAAEEELGQGRHPPVRAVLRRAGCDNAGQPGRGLTRTAHARRARVGERRAPHWSLG